MGREDEVGLFCFYCQSLIFLAQMETPPGLSGRTRAGQLFSWRKRANETMYQPKKAKPAGLAQ